MFMIAGLYIDDERQLPSDLLQTGWIRARSFHEAINMLEIYNFECISLDHDLASFYGNVELTGYHIVQWLAERKHNGKFVPLKYRVHTANPVGRANMESVINRYLL